MAVPFPTRTGQHAAEIGVEDRPELETEVVVDEFAIELGIVGNQQRPRLEELLQRAQVIPGQLEAVEDPGGGRRGELQKAQAAAVGIETGRLRVEAETGLLAERFDHPYDFVGVRNQLVPLCFHLWTSRSLLFPASPPDTGPGTRYSHPPLRRRCPETRAGRRKTKTNTTPDTKPPTWAR